jgi:DNA-binding SARP family transcriptional activator
VSEYTAAVSDGVHLPVPASGPSATDLAGLTISSGISAGIGEGSGAGPGRGVGLSPTGVGLQGPGAAGAARALLVAALASGGPEDPDARGHVVTPAATVAGLLGKDAADLACPPRLQVTAGLPEALARVEAEIIRRARVLADHDTVDVAALRHTEALAEPLPQFLLVTDTPDPTWQRRLTTTIRLGATVNVHAVLLGPWPPAQLTIAADGTVEPGRDPAAGLGSEPSPAARRVAVLDTATATDLLTMLHQALEDTPPSTPDQRPARSAGPGHAGPGHAGPSGASPPVAGDADVSGSAADERPATSDTDAREATPAPPPGRLPAEDTPAQPRPEGLALADAPSPPGSGGPGAPRGAPPAGAAPTPATTPAGRPTRPRVMVRILGAPDVLDPTGAPLRGLRAKSRELLYYLAAHREGAALRDVMEALWPDATVRRASERLSTCAGNARSVIRASLTTTPKATPTATASPMEAPAVNAIVNTGGRYHLDPDVVEVDWWQVLDLHSRITRTPEDDHETRLALLDRAVDLVDGRGWLSGEYLPDLEWGEAERVAATRLLLRLHVTAAELHAATDPRRAHELYEVACALDPLNDDVTRRSMTAAARLNDPDAIRARLSLHHRNLDDVGLEADPGTDDLAATLLRTLTPTRGHPPSVSVR